MGVYGLEGIRREGCRYEGYFRRVYIVGFRWVYVVLGVNVG